MSCRCLVLALLFVSRLTISVLLLFTLLLALRCSLLLCRRVMYEFFFCFFCDAGIAVDVRVVTSVGVVHVYSSSSCCVVVGIVITCVDVVGVYVVILRVGVVPFVGTVVVGIAITVADCWCLYCCLVMFVFVVVLLLLGMRSLLAFILLLFVDCCIIVAVVVANAGADEAFVVGVNCIVVMVEHGGDAVVCICSVYYCVGAYAVVGVCVIVIVAVVVCICCVGTPAGDISVGCVIVYILACCCHCCCLRGCRC